MINFTTSNFPHPHYRVRGEKNFCPKQIFLWEQLCYLRLNLAGDSRFAVKRTLRAVVFEYSTIYRFWPFFRPESRNRGGQCSKTKGVIENLISHRAPDINPLNRYLYKFPRLDLSIMTGWTEIQKILPFWRGQKIDFFDIF